MSRRVAAVAAPDADPKLFMIGGTNKVTNLGKGIKLVNSTSRKENSQYED